MTPILKVTNADYVRDHVLRLSFNDGATKLVDFWPLAHLDDEECDRNSNCYPGCRSTHA